MLMKTYRIRLFLLGFLTMLVFATIIVRLYYLQIIEHEEYVEAARQQQNKLVQLIPRRGDICDRNGVILALSHFSNNIILDTAKFKNPFDKATTATMAVDPEEKHGDKKSKKDPAKTKPEPDPQFLHNLALAINQPEDRLQRFFQQKPRRHILVRKAPEAMENQVRQLVLVAEKEKKIPHEAVLFELNSQRENPKGTLASHIVGYTNIDGHGDNIGKAGIERQYDNYLKGSVSQDAVPVTQTRKELTPLKEDAIEATYGNNVVLTIDEQIQMFTEAALKTRVGEVQALGGIAIVMDVKTGEILALASCPDFNLNDYSKVDPVQLRNRTLTDPIEIGSVMKILTTTLLIDRGLLSPDETIDCQGGRGLVDGRRFTDSHQLGMVPFREAFAASSNIGLATVGLRLEPKDYYAGLIRFGLGQPTGVDLPGEGPGYLPPLEKWSRLTRTSLPIGYETSLTAMEVIAALGAIGNDGLRLRPHVVREIRTHKGELVQRVEQEVPVRVASTETCRTVRELMEGVVTMKMGTGEKAAIPGYRIGGKTGTTIKTPPGVTPKTYIASFAGLLPIQNPRLAIYVYIDEPQGEIKFGGTIAAPVFRKIALHATHILGIPPDDPVAYAETEKELAADMGVAPQTTATLAMTTSTLAMEGVDEISSASGEMVMADELPDDPNQPRMPDCHGKTILETLQTLNEAGITTGIRTLGSGLMVRQEPLAGALVKPDKGVLLIFAHPSDSVKAPAQTAHPPLDKAAPANGPATVAPGAAAAERKGGPVKFGTGGAKKKLQIIPKRGAAAQP